MKKKPILEESVTRRMMKMAGISKLSDNFLTESEDLEETEELEETDDLEESDSLEEEEESLEEMEKVDHSHPDHKMSNSVGKGPGPGGHTLKNAPASKRNHLEAGMPPMEEPTDDLGMEDPAAGMDMAPEEPMLDDEPATVEGLIDAIVSAIEVEAPGYLEVASEEPMDMEAPMDAPDDMPMDDEIPDDMAEAGPRLKGATREVPMEESYDEKINEMAAYIARSVTERLKSK